MLSDPVLTCPPPGGHPEKYPRMTARVAWSIKQLTTTDPFNSSNPQACTYTHDDLARVASADCVNSQSQHIWTQAFTPDAFGNVQKTGNNGGTSFQPSYSSATNRMTSLGGSTPTYDANGNLTNDTYHTYTWDSAGKPVTVASIGLTYDALGRMVEQSRSGSYTQIVHRPSGDRAIGSSGD